MLASPRDIKTELAPEEESEIVLTPPGDAERDFIKHYQELLRRC